MNAPLVRFLLLALSLVSLGLAASLGMSPSSAQTERQQQPIYEEFGDSPIPPPKERKVLGSDYGGLLPGTGREETFYACTGCHSEGRIKRARMTRANWQATLERLSEEKGVPPLEADEQDIILDYLAEQYGP